MKASNSLIFYSSPRDFRNTFKPTVCTGCSTVTIQSLFFMKKKKSLKTMCKPVCGIRRTQFKSSSDKRGSYKDNNNAPSSVCSILKTHPWVLRETPNKIPTSRWRPRSRGLLLLCPFPAANDVLIDPGIRPVTNGGVLLF